MKAVIIIGTSKHSYTNTKIASIIKSIVEDATVIELENLPNDYIHSFLTPNFEFKEEFHEPIFQADKVFIICPEYNRSIPGPLKMFIDGSGWPSLFNGKEIYSIVAAGGIGDMSTLEHLESVMKFMGSDVKDGILLRHTMKTINDEETEYKIKDFILSAIQN